MQILDEVRDNPTEGVVERTVHRYPGGRGQARHPVVRIGRKSIMWDMLLSNPGLMTSFVFYVIMTVAVLIFATLTRYCEPHRSDAPPPRLVDYQALWSHASRWLRVESDRRFSPMQYWPYTVYARMFADAPERIRL
jgi:hypothetical protein